MSNRFVLLEDRECSAGGVGGSLDDDLHFAEPQSFFAFGPDRDSFGHKPVASPADAPTNEVHGRVLLLDEPITLTSGGLWMARGNSLLRPIGAGIGLSR